MVIAREVKVGAFMLAGLIIITAAIFMIGQERNVFSSKVQYKTIFTNVEGLKRGSPVRMGGVDVGIVSEVGYSRDPNDPRLYVTLEVVSDEARRIRQDSTATIAGKGLLGDKLVDVEPGTVGKPRIEAGGIIPSQESKDLTQAIAQLGTITSKAERVLNNLEQSTRSLADDRLHQDLKASVASLEGILGSVNRGEGYVGKLVKDEREAERVSRTIDGLEGATRQLAETLSTLNTVVAQVQQGPGFAHDLLYGEGPGQTLASFGSAADEVAITLKGMREGNGIGRSVIYGDGDSEQLMENLEAITTDVRAMIADIRAGKGTLGALLVDPSVYEDLKVLLGNVSRNKALRALVRYSVQQEEGAEAVEIQSSAPQSPSAGPEK